MSCVTFFFSERPETNIYISQAPWTGAQAIRELTPHIIYTEMGRGRNGPIDQSLKKPKISKNKQRGAEWERFHQHYKQQHNSLFLSEGLLAEMKKMSSQNLMNILLPNQCEQGH